MKELTKQRKVGKSGSKGSQSVKWQFFSALSFLQETMPSTSERSTNLEVCNYASENAAYLTVE